MAPLSWRGAQCGGGDLEVRKDEDETTKAGSQEQREAVSTLSSQAMAAGQLLSQSVGIDANWKIGAYRGKAGEEEIDRMSSSSGESVFDGKYDSDV